MTAGRLLTLALVLVPEVAAACPSCISSAYGDRTFNWAYLGLLVTPFVLACAIGGILLYQHYGKDVRRTSAAAQLAQHEETT